MKSNLVKWFLKVLFILLFLKCVGSNFFSLGTDVQECTLNSEEHSGFVFFFSLNGSFQSQLYQKNTLKRAQ